MFAIKYVRFIIINFNNNSNNNSNNNNNNGLLTAYPPSGSSPVENFNIKYEIYNIKSNNIGL